MQVFELFGSVTVDDSEVKESLEETEQVAQQTEQSTGNSFSNMAANFAKMAAGFGAAAGALTAALGGVVNSVTSTGDEIDKASARAGVSAQAYQELKFAAEQNNISQRSLERSLQNVNQEMGRGEDASEGFKSALDELNVDAEETEDVFTDSVTALQEMEDSQRAAALASDLFGDRAARELAPALREGEDSIAELRDRAQELGITMEDENVSASARFQDSLNEAKRVLGTIWREIAFEVLPVFQAMVDWIGDNAHRITATFEFIANVTGIVFRTMVAIIRDSLGFINDNLIQPFLQLVTQIWADGNGVFAEIVSNVWGIITNIFQGALTQLQEIIMLIGNVLAGDWEAAWGNLQNIFWSFVNTFKENIKLLWDTAKITASIIRDALAPLGGFFVELKDDVIGNVKAMSKGIRSWLGDKLAPITDRVEKITDGISGAFGSLRNAVTGNSYVPDMVNDIGDEWDKLQDEWDNKGKLALDDAEEDFKNFGENATQEGEQASESMQEAANSAAITWANTADDIGQSIADVTTGVIEGTNNWVDLISEFGNIFMGIMNQAIQQFITALITSQSVQQTWLAQTVSTMASAAASFISTAYYGLVSFFSFLGPAAPVAAAGVIGTAIAAIGKLGKEAAGSIGGSVGGGSSNGSENGDIDTDNGVNGGSSGSGTGGTMTLEDITGSAKDLLAPLGQLDRIVAIDRDIRNMLDQSPIFQQQTGGAREMIQEENHTEQGDIIIEAGTLVADRLGIKKLVREEIIPVLRQEDIRLAGGD